jgi:hypothetical protein
VGATGDWTAGDVEIGSGKITDKLAKNKNRMSLKEILENVSVCNVFMSFID